MNLFEAAEIVRQDDHPRMAEAVSVVRSELGAPPPPLSALVSYAAAILNFRGDEWARQDDDGLSKAGAAMCKRGRTPRPLAEQAVALAAQARAF